MPVTTERRTCSVGAPRWNSNSGLTTTACPACHTPRERLAPACRNPSAAPPGCKKSEAPRSTGVQASASPAAIAAAPTGVCVAPVAPELPAVARGPPLPTDAADEAPRFPAWDSLRHEVMYSNEDWVPTRMRSVRSMLSTVTLRRKETRPRSNVRDTTCESSPVRYSFSGSRTISAKPPPIFAKDLMGVTPVSDRRICVLLRSLLHAATTCAITWLSPAVPVTVTLRNATCSPSRSGMRLTSSQSSPRRRASTSKRLAR
mmetsp:Transcript_82780/g.239225  ORF Transcript_82780/g.239225 Transcript_82780/m.239225 type:complete len:259 (-) Transcript_82780:44-820(-)